MSFFKSLWGGIKAVGGLVGGVFKKKTTSTILNAAAAAANAAQQPDQWAGMAAGYANGIGLNGSTLPVDVGGYPPGSSWLDFLSGRAPLDLNKYITLPTVATTVKPVNWLMIGGIVLGCILLLRKPRSYGRHS